MSDVTPDAIEKKRNSLRHNFYSIQRPMTEEEMKMVLVPLFQEVALDITMMKSKVVFDISNKKHKDEDMNNLVLEMINDWNVHDEFRRFIVKSFSAANKKGIFRYDAGMMWKCPLNVHYVSTKSDEDEYEDGDIVI
jgi:hypothetical protein